MLCGSQLLALYFLPRTGYKSAFAKNWKVALVKLITAIVKPQKLDDVRDALGKVGVQGMTVTDVKGYGRQKGHSEVYRGTEYQVTFIPKVKLEIAVAGDIADQVVEAIVKSANTGSIGDGKVFVCDLEKAVRIRTGEVDESAL